MLIYESSSAPDWIRFVLSTSEYELIDDLNNKTTGRRLRHGVLSKITCGHFRAAVAGSLRRIRLTRRGSATAFLLSVGASD